MTDRYHHGNLRQAILDRALAIIADEGVEALSLRAVASELNVSHAAPRHHFASKQALLTAIAADGFAELGRRVAACRGEADPFLAAGRAYATFALEHPAAFEVMFTPTLLDATDPAYAEAAASALSALRDGAATQGPDAEVCALAGWSLVHGFAALALSGSLTRAGFAAPDADLPALVEQAARLLAPTTRSTP